MEKLGVGADGTVRPGKAQGTGWLLCVPGFAGGSGDSSCATYIEGESSMLSYNQRVEPV